MSVPKAINARGTLARVNIVALVLAVLAGAVQLGLRLPAWQALDDLPGVDAASLAGADVGPLPRVRGEFLEDLLGDSEYRRLFNPPAPAESAGGTPRRPGPVASPVPTPGPGTSPPPTLAGGGGLLAPGSWELAIAMTADRATVPAGGEITYTMTVSNVGTSPFPATGIFELQWHTPLYTTARAPQNCTLPVLGNVPVLDRLCGDGLLPLPGVGEVHDPTGGQVSDEPLVSLHNSWSSLGQFVIIPAGGTYVRHFRVEVSPAAPDGAVMVNHTHLDVKGDSAPAITSDVVSVTVTGGIVPAPPVSP